VGGKEKNGHGGGVESGVLSSSINNELKPRSLSFHSSALISDFCQLFWRY
jgi:hypothetical protein